MLAPRAAKAATVSAMECFPTRSRDLSHLHIADLGSAELVRLWAYDLKGGAVWYRAFRRVKPNL